ncbi:hypothetical protein [Hymenobacter sp.]|uniref:hypothetical protein n=1 Tax=Hymenobacter sp. TaxID=1898978 RepID=UPI002EDA7872
MPHSADSVAAQRNIVPRSGPPLSTPFANAALRSLLRSVPPLIRSLRLLWLRSLRSASLRYHQPTTPARLNSAPSASLCCAHCAPFARLCPPPRFNRYRAPPPAAQPKHGPPGASGRGPTILQQLLHTPAHPSGQPPAGRPTAPPLAHRTATVPRRARKKAPRRPLPPSLLGCGPQKPAAHE